MIPSYRSEKSVTYEIIAQKGEVELLEGVKTKTYGYNGMVLGPVIRLRRGQNAKLRAKNDLEETTTFHWHGLIAPSINDGGPHEEVYPGKEEELSFSVNQGAATLWLHPHPHKKTASQVYNGLAALIYIEDEVSDSLDLPKTYGVDDIPLIIQDRFFTEEGQWDYSKAYQADGTLGDTTLVNATINPMFDLTRNQTRLRVLNGSNARNYYLHLTNDRPFKQIATDGGFLEQPVELKELLLTPGERAEIIIDTHDLSYGDSLELLTEDHVLIEFYKRNKSEKNSVVPEKLTVIPIPTSEDKNKAVKREFHLSGMGETVAINGEKFDMSVINFESERHQPEIWRVINDPSMMGGMIHPFHIHGTQFQLLSRNGQLVTGQDKGWKDTVGLLPNETIELLVKFKEPGVFMYHCHNLEHEDNGMMGQFLVN